MARLPTSVPTLANTRVEVEIDGMSASFSTRILGHRGRRMLISVPLGRAPSGAWAKPGARGRVRLGAGPGDSGSSFAFTVLERRLKPVPLLIVEALEDIPLTAEAPTEDRGLLIAVASGKGGTGKTTFSVNLAWHAAARGLRTALLDADIGTANASLHFGLSPDRHLGLVLTGKASLETVAIPIHSRLALFPGAAGELEAADPSPWQFGRLLANIDAQLASWDVFIVDLGAGIHRQVTNLLLTADRTVVVAQDDPAAYLGAHSLIKEVLRLGIPGALSLVVNRAADLDGARAGAARFAASIERLTGGMIELLGVVPDDPAARASLASGRPLIALHPKSPAATAYRLAADRLLQPVFSRNQETPVKKADDNRVRAGGGLCFR